MSLPSSTSSGRTDSAGLSTTSSLPSTLLSSSTSTAFTSSLTSGGPLNLSSTSASASASTSLPLSVSPTVSMNASTSTILLSSTSLSVSSSSPILNLTSSITTTLFPSSSNSLTSTVSSSSSLSTSSGPLSISSSSTASSRLPLTSTSVFTTLRSTSSISDTSSISETTSTSTHALHTSAESAWTSTYLTTTFLTSTKRGGTVTTVSRVSTLVSSASGVLNTGRVSPNNNPFPHHPGAIVGVTLGVIIAVVFSAIWIFLAHRRHTRMQQGAQQGSGVALNASQEGSWRSPFDDGEDGNDVYQTEMAEQYPRILAALELANIQAHSGEIGGDDIGSPNAPNPRAGPRRSSSLGQRPYMPGFGQAAETIAMRVPVDEIGHIPPRRSSSSASNIAIVTHPRPTSSIPETGYWQVEAEVGRGSRGASPATHVSSSEYFSGHGQEDVPRGESAASFYMYTSPPSSHGHGAASSSSAASVDGRRFSGSKPLYLPPSSHSHGVSSSATPGLGRRFSGPLGPPTSFKGKEESDTHSLKGFIGLLRRSSNPTVEVSPPQRSQSLRSHMCSPYISSPSSLLVPQPTGTGNPSNISHRPSLSMSLRGGQMWPGSEPLTLPPPPSPVVTTDSLPVLNGLLDPRLESLASLADHEDYSRPIGGVVNNQRHSTTTFNTQDTVTTRGDEPAS